MKYFALCFLIVVGSGCATGYGTLAGMGVGIIIGAAGATNTGDSSYIGQGAALGALIGVAAAGTASLIARHEGKAEAQEQIRVDAQKIKEAQEREENRKVLEAIRRERAELGRLAPRAQDVQPNSKRADGNSATQNALEQKADEQMTPGSLQ